MVFTMPVCQFEHWSSISIQILSDYTDSDYMQGDGAEQGGDFEDVDSAYMRYQCGCRELQVFRSDTYAGKLYVLYIPHPIG